MLQWNDLHPYNAVHVARIPAALDLERLRRAIRHTLELQGLTNLSWHRDAGAYGYHGGPAVEDCAIKILPTGAAASGAMQAEIEQQLNTGFVQGERLNPFRFFVEAEDDSFSLGLVYFHPVADAEAMVQLMTLFVESYRGGVGDEFKNLREIHPPRHDRLRRQSPALLLRKLVALPLALRDMRRSSRPHYGDAGDFRNGFQFFQIPPGGVRRLLETSRHLGVTLHDLFLALLLKALAPLAADRLGSRKRRRISIGSIVNLRKDLGPDFAGAFGLFLGSFVVTHEVPEDLSVKALAGDIRQQTLRIKQRKLYLGVPTELIFARLFLSLFSTEQRKKFYQKNYPLWGGITNMNLNRLGEQNDGTAMSDYYRAVSTGPATPLVLSMTTVGEVVNVGVSYRTTVFGAVDIARVQQGMLEGIQSLAGGA